ncbi:MAG TPA: MgtC/SapB family protein [Thermodesulfobacteriota bacterium]|nr:MgtC/SapB family protein [Thermodesulfobacteriota bacterium]
MELTGIFEYDPVEVKVLVHVVVAMLLGALVGLDREFEGKPAGLRTNMLVAGSAALLVWCGRMVVPWYGLGEMALGSDPLRIIGAIITGVSFLGAGTIIRGGGSEKVHGLTTAATLLFVASVGICVALSKIVIAIGVTVLALLTLRGVGHAEDLIRTIRTGRKTH